VTLDTLYRLYQFDMGLRHAILPVLEFFEVQLRAKLSYHLAMAYGSTGFADSSHFRQDKQSIGSHKSLMNKFRTEVKRQDDLPFVRHHNTKYGGQFPVWAAVELFSFGMLAQLYDVMTERDQQTVSSEYGMSPQALASLIGSAVDVRNICAHYSRLYNQPIEELPEPNPAYPASETDRVFALLLALRSVAGGHRVYEDMILGIERLHSEYPQADLALCGFPQDWQQTLADA
jgi:abortive infection bacteriophage resistance protein